MSRRQNNDMGDKTERSEPKKRLITRRRALIAGGGVVGSAALAGGGFLLHDYWLRFGRDFEAKIRDHRVRLPSSLPRMVIAHGTDPALNVRAAIDRLGGIKQFVGADDVVVIKPNIGWDRTPAQAANTDPKVVAEVARVCLEVKPKRVIVCDCPVNEARSAFETSGIMKAALEAGAEVILPEESRYQTVVVSPRLGTWDVLEPFVTATKLINVPVAKHHSLTGTTAGMKNWIGITGKLRIMFHKDIERSIAELSALMRPTLTVVDASRVMMEAGPRGGNLNSVKHIGAVAAGVDPVALDAWAFSLFGVGLDGLPQSLYLAEGMGLGKADFKSLAPVEIATGEMG
ncbi:MAG: DUF362 domain-containing protein [Proteobacteria bacterium]|nr:DUF362 domain-containing protein [Pseudomonadota bacterium]